MKIVPFIILLFLLYLLAIRGRRGHAGLQSLQGFDYAHRGLHGDGLPENSMAAFRAALENGYGIELDIHLLKDGTLAVMHDSSLARTAGADVEIEDLTAADLGNYRLEGTDQQIPTFEQVLQLFDGKAPIIIELKPARGNHAALAEAACKVLESYDGAYCIESFDPRCLMWLKKNRPGIVRGQLAQNYFIKSVDQPWIVKFLLTYNLMNFLTVPDFIAYRFDHRNSSVSNVLCQKLWGVQCVGWTLRDAESHAAVKAEGWLSIFEYFRP